MRTLENGFCSQSFEFVVSSFRFPCLSSLPYFDSTRHLQLYSTPTGE